MASKFQIPIAFKSDPRGLKQAESAVSGFGKKLIGIGALVGGAFAIRGLANFAKDAVLGAERAAQFDSILKQVAKTTGVFGADVDAATSRMIKFADAHEMVIGVEAELIKETQGVLLSFKAVGASGNEVGGVFDRATKAAFDMAAVLKTDARGSAVQLGKALENPIKGVTALAKAGTTFTDQQKEQIKVLVESGNLLAAQELILAEVESQYGGAAEAAALSSEKISLAFGQVKDALGTALAPAFEAFATYFIEKIVPPLTTFFEEDFPAMLTALEPITIRLKDFLSDMADAIRRAFDLPEDADLLQIFLDNLAELGENPQFIDFMDLLVDAFEALLPEIIDLVPELADLGEELIPLLIDLLPILTDFVRGLSDIIGDTAQGFRDADEGGWGMAESIENLTAVADAAQDPLGALKKMGDDIADSFRNAGDRVRELFRRMREQGTLNVTLEDYEPGSRRAVGGPVSARDSFLVGERGPEIFTPGVGGFITPNNRLGGGGGSTYNITVNAGMGANGTQLGREIVNAIKRYERTSGPVFASA